MKKTPLFTLTAAATIAGLALANPQSTHAATKPATSTVQTTDDDAAAAQTAVDQAQQAATTTAAAKADAEADLSAAQTTADQTAADKAAAEATKAEATPEAIAQAQADADAAAANTADAQAASDAADQTVSDAQADVDTKTATDEAAQSAKTAADDAVTAAQAALTGEDDPTVTASQQAVDEAQTAADQAGTAVDNATAAQTQAQQAVDDATNADAEVGGVVLTPDFLEVYHEINGDGYGGPDEDWTNNVLAQARDATQLIDYQPTAADDAEIVPDMTQLTNAEARELSEFAASVINDIRAQFGITPIHVSDGSVQAALLNLGGNMYRGNYGDNSWYDIDSETSVAAAQTLGLPYGTQYDDRGNEGPLEALGAGTIGNAVMNFTFNLGDKSSPMSNLKRGILAAIASLMSRTSYSTDATSIYADGSSVTGDLGGQIDWLTDFILDQGGSKNYDYLGMEIDDKGSLYFTFTNVTGVDHSYPFFNDTTTPAPIAHTKDTTALAKAQQALADATTALTTAQATKTAADTALQAAQAKLAADQQTAAANAAANQATLTANLEAAEAQATAAAATATATHDALTAAQAALTDAQTAAAEAHEALTAAQAAETAAADHLEALQQADANLAIAQAADEAAQAALTDAQAAYEATLAPAAAAASALKAAQAHLATVQHWLALHQKHATAKPATALKQVNLAKVKPVAASALPSTGDAHQSVLALLGLSLLSLLGGTALQRKRRA
ncbi:MAG: SEC10/PgrA surface exclusion domain-containing protein [Lactobacillus sp.]|jgi:SEC10/PgrA surface exclusion-like protein/LPXTG-motif cell wall-anchored protein|nr:SEC10/PgrA surface exclusion domain-containing protein [Lactobacillus sp.]MCI1942320.1 SEC10/PgrA surface exclusion domain-containing protein [Lactobacillus sp.]MCI1972740.1 SEC10/PgrA surface exclusion domain-containing protein [Lactobacillus sp.]MCI2016561.1 SEC10/PgrA surface exclusion domain-containing protein [Lactobacillus sp.]MCI2037374.1 SEC10/PgrA surface exclusion domain-containing protein [Lactobacillus sp.]